MYSLDVWVAQQIREVDEDGTCCIKIVLRSVDNGTPWQTWAVNRTGEYKTDAAKLIEEINNVKNGLAEQFPVGKNAIVFIALDANGVDVARFPDSILGRNRSASAANLIQNEAGTAISQTMLAFADTFRQILIPVNAQFSLAMKHQEALQQTIIAQSAYITSLQERHVLEAAARVEQGPSELMTMLKDNAGPILEMLTEAVKSPAVPRAVRVVAEAIPPKAAAS